MSLFSIKTIKPKNKDMNRNVKIFLVNGIPFAIFTGILYSILYGFSVGLKSGLAAGMLFGFLMYFILGFLHSRAVTAVAGKATKETLETCHERQLRLPLSYDSTFDMCMKSLSAVKGCTAQEKDLPRGIIIAKSSVNWKTWGDTISYNIDRVSDESTEIKVSSWPSSWTTIVDYGKNLENVESIVSFLEKYAETAPASDQSV